MSLLFVFILLLSAGGVVGAAFYNCRYEDALPVGITAIVALCFVFGLLGVLEAGVYIVSMLCIVSELLALAYVLMKREFGKFLRRLFTPGFVIFALLVMVLYVLNRDKVAEEIDEYTHWASVVKIMFFTNELSNVPGSDVLYASYMPGMALFQYFFEKIAQLLEPGFSFREDLMYLAYQLYMFSFLFPFLSGMRLRRASLASLIFFLLPLCFFPTVYSCIYIDPFLGVVAGVGTAIVLLGKERKCSWSVVLLSAMVSLVLAKDSGAFFAAFLLLSMLASVFLKEKNSPVRAHHILSTAAFGGLAVLLPKGLWTLSVAQNGVPKAFPIQFSLTALAEREPIQLIKRLFTAQLNQPAALGDTGLNVAYFILFLLLSIALFALIRNRSDIQHKLGWLCVARYPLYLLGLFLLYLFSFSVNDAKYLGGMDRYVRTDLMCSLTTVVALAVLRLEALPAARKGTQAALMLCGVMLITPWHTATEFLNRKAVSDSVEQRQAYVDFTHMLREKIPDLEKYNVYFVIQSEEVYTYFAVRHMVYPIKVNMGQWYTYSAEPDPSTLLKDTTCDEWRQTLLDYDYVALYQIQDDFASHFGSLFESADAISSGKIYSVNSTEGTLHLCP